MKILIYYRKTQKSKLIECERVEAGPGGITWFSRGDIGFVGYDTENYDITIFQ